MKEAVIVLVGIFVIINFLSAFFNFGYVMAEKHKGFSPMEKIDSTWKKFWRKIL